ncbi:MAG: hypothetical protein ACK5YR_14990 [Pirellula sp.]|jgi:hypothetical protein
MRNPYAPPETNVAQSDGAGEGEQKPAKAIIPAVIGMFTYGSSFPYALVLCVEQYARSNSRPVPSSTHIALVLAVIGSLGWGALSILYMMPLVSLIVGNASSPYASIGLMALFSNLVFVLWTIWRIHRFRQPPNVS